MVVKDMTVVLKDGSEITYHKNEETGTNEAIISVPSFAKIVVDYDELAFVVARISKSL